MKTAYQHSKELMQKIKPKMAYNGENFESWKKRSREKLYELLGLDKFEKVDPDFQVEYEKKIDGATEIRFTFQSEIGYRVPCHLLLPDGALNPPLMICLQGHSKGMHISLGRVKYPGDEESIKNDRDFCVRAVKEGFAAIALEQRDFGECGGSEKGPDCFSESLVAFLMGRTTVGERVWDLSRLIDVVESELSSRVDVTKICCMGNSGGGTATAYLAALDDRVFLAMPSCAMCTYKDSIGAMIHCSCNYVPSIANYFDMGDIMAMAHPKFFVQVSGIMDTDFPILGAVEVFEKGKKVYASLNSADRCSLVKGNGGHRFYADESWPIVHRYVKK